MRSKIKTKKKTTKGLFMMSLLHTQPQNFKRKYLSGGENYTGPGTRVEEGGERKKKNERGISELAGNVTFRNILFFIRAVSGSLRL